ncbi:hypothetical protein [Undibacterium sp. Di24W]|uniref:hypothetical protein n=1 Tax=Undibacterium sp. Di24W TaxID=3413033 RepID=UPI003BF61574
MTFLRFFELLTVYIRVLALGVVEYSEVTADRNEVVVAAYRSHAYSMEEVAAYFLMRIT